MIVRLPYRPPFTYGPLWNSLAAHSVPGLDERNPTTGAHSRTIAGPTGPATVTVRVRPGEEHMEVDIEPASAADMDDVVEVVRRWLDLEADPTVVDAALARDSIMAPLVSKRPGLRRLGSVDGFETAVLTILGQQVSLGAARTFGSRLVSEYGGDHGRFRLFPQPGDLAAESTDRLRAVVGLTNARARTVTALATAVSEGLSLDHRAVPEQFRSELLSVPGIGPWTVDYLTVRILGDADAFVPGDLVLKRALNVDSAGEAADLAESWRPWRAYALFHLWTEAVYG
ncbi:DNA-3-methyladenine glycosylase family protein [Rhodococcus sp. NPDC058521]|uniref:DNA-3-methyladenine glycosylase family protein n=1 Tax=Rhodococcus sp. NPDC058521 TaxID=3346536 RepID=UPI00364D336B